MSGECLQVTVVLQIDANLFQSTTTTVDKYVEGDNFGIELLSFGHG